MSYHLIVRQLQGSLNLFLFFTATALFISVTYCIVAASIGSSAVAHLLKCKISTSDLVFKVYPSCWHLESVVHVPPIVHGFFVCFFENFFHFIKSVSKISLAEN